MAKRGRPVKPISKFDIDLLRWHFVDGRSFTDIAAEDNTSRQNIQQRIKRTVEKMAEQVHL
jgi:predicted DNA-binding protein YlxM (UPF0122 family)